MASANPSIHISINLFESLTHFLDRRTLFLENLRTSNSYKRYLGSPLRYAGGKSWAVGYVIERLPKNLKRLISPFFGGGSIEIAIAKELGIEVIGFDIFDVLVNYWQVQINYPQELYLELKKLKPDRETYHKIKEELKKHWQREINLPSIKLAAYYFFNHNLSYGPGFLEWMSSVYANEKVYNNLLQRVKSFRVKNLKVCWGDFKEIIPKYEYDFLYCDPPYYLGDDSSVFRGLYPQRNFPIHHQNFEHQVLRELLLKHKGGFILSYNDSPTIRKWYKDCEIVELPVHYTMGQGEIRIGTNRIKKNNTHIKKSRELLIIKYPQEG
ncbi:MAG: DNA adenine methylase [Caldimicrobium sp.]|nr:DNA adenine methylase [Caldimicrobium sp.]MCX7613476.1 DNA adenine methylase [Caldimicrobium sp.]MDW8182952.1 DNA adenine methylase [Caldimicrobium sp.]